MAMAALWLTHLPDKPRVLPVMFMVVQGLPLHDPKDRPQKSSDPACTRVQGVPFLVLDPPPAGEAGNHQRPSPAPLSIVPGLKRQ